MLARGRVSLNSAVRDITAKIAANTEGCLEGVVFLSYDLDREGPSAVDMDLPLSGEGASTCLRISG